MATVFTHTQNAAAANANARPAHVVQRIQTRLIISCSNNCSVKFRRGVDIMVVIIEPDGGETLGLGGRQHAQGDAGFQLFRLHRFDHIDNDIQIFVAGITPGRAHAKARGALLSGRSRAAAHFLDRQ